MNVKLFGPSRNSGEGHYDLLSRPVALYKWQNTMICTMRRTTLAASKFKFHGHTEPRGV